MRFASWAEHGVNEDQCGVHQTELDAFAEDHPNTPPEVLELYYGVKGEPTLQQQHQTGAGHPDDEGEDSDNDSDAVVDEVTDQSHEAVKVPLSECPFDDAGLLLFQSALKIVSEEGILPGGIIYVKMNGMVLHTLWLRRLQLGVVKRYQLFCH